MATEVLRPQDCLRERIRVPPATSFSRRKTAPSYYGNQSSSCNYYYNYNYYYNNNGFNHPNPRFGRTSAVSRRSSSDDSRTLAKTEKVTILRRGESLDSKIESEALRKDGNGGLAGVGTDRLVSVPAIIPRRIGIVSPAAENDDVYAGSAFVVSPSPSSLPLPSFSKKQTPMGSISVDDSATRDLRRLLRIG